jgi:hypothetical protein
MKTIIAFLKNWFQRNGLIKILTAFALLIISVMIVKHTQITTFINIFTWVGWISFAYMCLTVLIFLIAGIINSIKDHK